jgi:hypothetical protein
MGGAQMTKLLAVLSLILLGCEKVVTDDGKVPEDYLPVFKQVEGNYYDYYGSGDKLRIFLANNNLFRLEYKGKVQKHLIKGCGNVWMREMASFQFFDDKENPRLDVVIDGYNLCVEYDKDVYLHFSKKNETIVAEVSMHMGWTTDSNCEFKDPKKCKQVPLWVRRVFVNNP